VTSSLNETGILYCRSEDVMCDSRHAEGVLSASEEGTRWSEVIFVLSLILLTWRIW